MAYFCWDPHHEDLTAQVEAQIHSEPLPVVQFGFQQPARFWTVTVTCSQGHVNIFQVSDPGAGIADESAAGV